MKRIAAFIPLTVALAAYAGAPQIAGTFSDFRASARSGDFVGAEMIITRANAKYSATLQCSEGAPGKAIPVAIVVKGSAVRFSVREDNPAGCPAGLYSGTVSDDGLDLSNAKYEWHHFLKRSRSFWAK